MAIAQIRKEYGVPAKCGLKVRYKGYHAYIVRANQYNHLVIRTITPGIWWGHVAPDSQELEYGTELHKRRGSR